METTYFVQVDTEEGTVALAPRFGISFDTLEQALQALGGNEGAIFNNDGELIYDTNES